MVDLIIPENRSEPAEPASSNHLHPFQVIPDPARSGRKQMILQNRDFLPPCRLSAVQRSADAAPIPQAALRPAEHQPEPESHSSGPGSGSDLRIQPERGKISTACWEVGAWWRTEELIKAGTGSGTDGGRGG